MHFGWAVGVLQTPTVIAVRGQHAPQALRIASRAQLPLKYLWLVSPDCNTMLPAIFPTQTPRLSGKSITEASAETAQKDAHRALTLRKQGEAAKTANSSVGQRESRHLRYRRDNVSRRPTSTACQCGTVEDSCLVYNFMTDTCTAFRIHWSRHPHSRHNITISPFFSESYCGRRANPCFLKT